VETLVAQEARPSQVSGLPTICSFWHGRLSLIERVSIASFLAHGHRFALYAYEDVGEVPVGCELRDAGEVLPRERLFFYKGSRTPAVFADLFRLELMLGEAGIWADCDVYCVKPFAGLAPYVFGIEEDGNARNGFRAQVNNAVFRCPPDAELLGKLLATFEPGATPPGMPLWRRVEVAVRRALGDPLPVEHMQFGATGPWPLNYWVRKLGLTRFALPREVFYPVPYEKVRGLLQPGFPLGDYVTERTLGIHMWHSALAGRSADVRVDAQPQSFLADAAKRLGVT
jgi:hypothetical protein